MADRMGKHRPDKASIGIYVTDEFRALLALVVDMSGETATDIIMEGVRRKATDLGILVNGAVAKKYQGTIQIIKEAFAAKRREAKTRKEGK
jgi:hypothetical protein